MCYFMKTIFISAYLCLSLQTFCCIAIFTWAVGMGISVSFVFSRFWKINKNFSHIFVHEVQYV